MRAPGEVACGRDSPVVQHCPSISSSHSPRLRAPRGPGSPRSRAARPTDVHAEATPRSRRRQEPDSARTRARSPRPCARSRSSGVSAGGTVDAADRVEGRVTGVVGRELRVRQPPEPGPEQGTPGSRVLDVHGNDHAARAGVVSPDLGDRPGRHRRTGAPAACRRFGDAFRLCVIEVGAEVLFDPVRRVLRPPSCDERLGQPTRERRQVVAGQRTEPHLWSGGLHGSSVDPAGTPAEGVTARV